MNKKTSEHPGERIAKVIARSGVCSRREAEKLIESGQVTLNGERMVNPAINVTEADDIRVKGIPLKANEKPRLWLYHKPSGLVTSHKDEQKRATVFSELPKDMPRVISVGRLDLNTEGLLLLTNDGGLARYMELPSTAWERCYRVRIYGLGGLSDDKIAELKAGVTVDEVRYGPVIVERESAKDSARNAWALVTLTEGKNREIRKVFEYVGCTVSRLIRVSYGPFTLGNLNPGEVREVPNKVLLEQFEDILK